MVHPVLPFVPWQVIGALAPMVPETTKLTVVLPVSL